MAASENNMFGDLFVEPESSNIVYGCAPRPTQKKDGSVDAPPPGRGESAFCGIKNQGATCYLNSLIQTLLLTPELREELFRLGPDELGKLEDAKKPNCKVRKIPIQLQMLLARLLLLNQYACGTEDLTNSFGWVDSEELQQHDVQELSRILFCAIEDSLVGTSGHDIIKKLYRGITANTITCLCCGNVSENLEDFLDLNIAIATRSNLTSVLRDMFVEKELMNGKNQYRCENCKTLVDAEKGAVIKTLPPILTLSLLRFSFDYNTLRRYKEIRRFEFPLSLNMKSYFQNKSISGCGDHKPDECYEYDLYSVIIHSGSAHGGHYHAYIRDIDGLGNVPPGYDPTPSISNNSSPAKSGGIMNDCADDPVEMLACVLAKLGGQSVPLNKLGEVFREDSGTSWAKQYRRKYGTMIKFLQNHLDVFAVDTRNRTVSFRLGNSFVNGDHNVCNNIASRPGNGSGDCWNSTERHNNMSGVEKVEEKDSTDPECVESNVMNGNVKNESSDHSDTLLNNGIESDTHPLSNVWFDFNDSHVKPIVTHDITQKYEGRESAYMLFYRRRNLSRPLESLGNLLYGIPNHIQEMIEKENCNLEDLRTEYNSLLNVVSLHVFFPSMFVITNGLVEIAKGGAKQLSDHGISYSIDRRKTIADMMAELKGMSENHQGQVSELECNVVKELPHGGIHVYEHINQDPILCVNDSLLENGMNLLLWDGSTLNGHEINSGVSNEPIVLNAKCQIQNKSCLHSIEFQGTTFHNVILGDLQNLFVTKFGLENVSNTNIGRMKREEAIYFEENASSQAIGDLGVSYVENFILDIELKDAETSAKTEGDDALSINISLGEILEKRLLDAGVFGSSNKLFHIFKISAMAELSSLISIKELKSKIFHWILKDCEDKFDLDSLHLYLERQEDCGSDFRLELHEDQNLEQGGVVQNSNIKLEIGSPPDDSEYHVLLYVQKGNKLKLPVKRSQATREVLIKTHTVAQCIDNFIEKRNLSRDLWHLRCLKSNKELGDILTCPEHTIEKTSIQHGCSMVLCPGGVPSEGRLRIPIWYYPRNIPLAKAHVVFSSHPLLSIWNSFLQMEDFEPSWIGHVEIEKDATLYELKCEILKHQFIMDKNFTSSEEICLRSISNRSQTRFHLQDTSSVKRLRLGPGAPLAVQAVSAIPEQNFVILHVTFHTPGTLDYVNPCEFSWDSTTPSSHLPLVLANMIQLDVKDILVAKQSSETGEWEIIKSKEGANKSATAKTKSANKKGSKNKKGQGKGKTRRSGGSKSPGLDGVGIFRDGDNIRVKCVTKESEVEGGPTLTDFKCEKDLAAIKRMKDSKSRDSANAPEQHKNEDDDSQLSNMNEHSKPKTKREETLRIHVDKF